MSKGFLKQVEIFQIVLSPGFRGPFWTFTVINVKFNRKMIFYGEITEWDKEISEKINWPKKPLLLRCLGPLKSKVTFWPIFRLR